MGSIESFVQQHDYKGRMLGGVYRLDSFLGHGGFGEVWRGTDTRDGKPVAVKLLPAGVEKAGKSLEQMEHECRMLINLSHPNICRVLDYIHDKDLGVALVTEFVDGTDIYSASTAETAGHYIIQLLQALSYLHGKDVYHFDIKPGNVLVSNGAVKLIDFGLASLFPEKKKAGTPSYMAPEIFTNEGKKDARTELYAVGVLWLYCLTRHNPFRSVSLQDAEAKHLTWTSPPYLPNLPGGRAIKRLLELKPEDRFQKVSELLESLQLSGGGGASLTDEIAAAYGSASGEFIGRQDIVDKVLEWSKLPNVGKSTWMAIVGEGGSGKSRLLNHCKLKAQVEGCRTIEINSADKVTLESIKPLADSLAEPGSPLLIVLDDYDKWFNTLAAEPLRQLLEVAHHHPHPSTHVFCLISCADTHHLPSYFSRVHLSPFSVEEVAQFIGAVAPVPSAKRQDLANRLWERTNGNPRLLTQAVVALTLQGVLVSESGGWDEHLFEDISIDVPEFSIDPGSIVQQSPDDVLVLSQEDRKTGHPLRALDRLLNYSSMTEKLLLEAVECAISTGKAKQVVALIQDHIDCMPDKGRLLYQVGILHMVQNDHETARKVLLTALAQARGDLALSISIRNQLARCDLLQGERQRAIAQFRATRSEEAKLEDGAVILNNELGHALLSDKHYDEALTVLDEDVQKYKKAGHVRRLLQTLMWRGNVRSLRGETDKAKQDYTKVMGLARDYQELKLLGESYNALAGIMLQTQNVNEGMGFYRKALSLHYVLHQLPGAAVIMNNQGLCSLSMHQLQEAKYRFESAMEFLKEAPEAWRSNLVQSFLGLAEIGRVDKQFKDADAMLDQAEEVARKYNVWNEHVFSVLLTRAEIRRDEGNKQQGLEIGMNAKLHAKTDSQVKAWEEFMQNLKHN